MSRDKSAGSPTPWIWRGDWRTASSKHVCPRWPGARQNLRCGADSFCGFPNMKRVYFALFAFMLVGCASAPSQQNAPLAVRSPDGKIEVRIQAAGALRYGLSVDGATVLSDSALGLEFRDGISLGRDVTVVKVDRRSEDSSWENRLGKRRTVRDCHNEIRISLRENGTVDRRFEVVFRAFDDGVAFRYVLPEQPDAKSVTLQRELTSFTFANDAPCFAGSQLNGFTGPQEWEFWPTNLSALPTTRPTGLPLLVDGKPAWIAITESDLLDYAGMWLTTSADPP